MSLPLDETVSAEAGAGPPDAPAGTQAAAGGVARRLAAGFRDIYMTADVRSLAAGRIVMALVLWLDLVKRWVQITDWYTNDGLVPNHTLLWRPSFDYVFSFFYMASYTHEAVAGFVVCAIAYTALLVGVWTKLAQVVSLVCVLSLHGRLLLFDNGGDVVLGLLCVWTTFLPTGRRWSVDAVLGRGEAAAGAHPPSPLYGAPPEGGQRVVSLGVLALVVQLAMIYFFNAVHKSGVTWRDGTAVHYVLHLDRMVTPFGLWLRARMTPSLSRVMTWSALATEWTLPVLLLSPFAVRFCRRLAIGLIIGLHAGFGACMNLGNFVPAMIAFSPNLIPGEDWNALARWWARDAQRVRRLERLRAWMSAAITRAAAWLTPGRWQRVSEPGPVVRTFLRNLPLVREATVVLFVVVASNQLLDENEAAHRVIDHHNSRAMGAAVTYLNLFQGWSMFAPEVFTSDLNMAVDAITVEGRHVDPFNEAANPRTPMPGAQIPPGMGPNWLYYQYVTRIPWRPAYYHAFQEWILRYPERTGRPGDRIVSMRVYKVEDDSPPPGEQTPRNARATLLFKYPD